MDARCLKMDIESKSQPFFQITSRNSFSALPTELMEHRNTHEFIGQILNFILQNEPLFKWKWLNRVKKQITVE